MKNHARTFHRSTSLLASLAAVLIVTATGTALREAGAAPKSIGPIKANVGDCVYGFKQTGKDAKGSYRCVSQRLRCPNPPAVMLTQPRFNKATGRFEYVCAVPAR